MSEANEVQTDKGYVRPPATRLLMDWRSFNAYAAEEMGLNESILWVDINEDLRRTPLDDWGKWTEGSFEKLLAFYSFWTRQELIKAFKSLAKQEFLQLGPIDDEVIFYRPHASVIEHGRERESIEAKPRESAPTKRQKYPGFVYLIAGGEYYKIGFSCAPTNRIRQISIALPFPTSLIHSIKTEDMLSLETYWHQRFADKRTGGEWFSLTADDVAEFCAVSEMEVPSC